MQDYTDGRLRPQNLDSIPVVPPRGYYYIRTRMKTMKKMKVFIFCSLFIFFLYFFSKM